jgi:hypothetical protein
MEDLPSTSQQQQQSSSSASSFTGLENLPSMKKFVVPPKGSTSEALEGWRKASFTLNASRRFRYVADLKKRKEAEEARQVLPPSPPLQHSTTQHNTTQHTKSPSSSSIIPHPKPIHFASFFCLLVLVVVVASRKKKRIEGFGDFVGCVLQQFQKLRVSLKAVKAAWRFHDGKNKTLVLKFCLEKFSMTVFFAHVSKSLAEYKLLRLCTILFFSMFTNQTFFWSFQVAIPLFPKSYLF